jgi:hypothetical protein
MGYDEVLAGKYPVILTELPASVELAGKPPVMSGKSRQPATNSEINGRKWR